MANRLARAAAALICVTGLLVVTAGPAHASMLPRPSYGPYKASVDIDGRGSMNVNDRTFVNAYTAGETLYLTCQDTGPAVGGSTIWDYTPEGYWEPDTYIKTGTTGFVAGISRCLAVGIDGRSTTGSVNGEYKAAVDIDGRGSMNPADRVKYNAYLAGSTVLIKCQDHGPAVAGDTVWDFTSDDYWIPDTYVHTGSTGVISGMPICSTLGIDGNAPVDSNGGQRFVAATDLNGYSAKSLTSTSVNNAYLDGDYVTVMCQAYGQYNYGGDAIWDKTSSGYWVADYYVHTGSSGFVMSRCDNDPASGASGSGNRFLAETTLNGYHGKSLTSTYVNDKYAGGSYITVTCQAYGEFNYGGSAVWDKTTDGLWVADYYVKTGVTGIFMTRCDNDPQPTGGPGNPTVPGTPAAGSVASAQIRGAIVNAVRTQLGTHEWGDNCNPYGPSGVNCGEPWCSIFASWAWRQGGIDVSIPYSGDFYYWAQRHGTLRSTSNIRPGDLVLFGSGPSWPDSNHVGVVVDVLPDGSITTIEGNFHNAVTKVGPYQPSQAATYHPGDGGIFAVVAPINDSGDTKWGSEADPGLDNSWDINSETPVCSDSVAVNDYPEYKVCLQNQVGEVRAMAVVTPSTSKASGASVTLTVGSTTVSARCLTIYSGSRRTCATAWTPLTGRTFSADAVLTSNGSTLPTRHVFSMKMIGEQQTKYNYCGPASTRAALLTMGLSAPSQDTIANEEQTTTYDFTLPTNIPASLNSRVGSTNRYGAYFYPNEGLPELIGLESVRASIDKGRPVILLVNPGYLPPAWNITSTFGERHYIVIYGYGGSKVNIATGVPFDLESLNVWDPANNWSHTITMSQFYQYTYDAELVGTGSFVAITA